MDGTWMRKGAGILFMALLLLTACSGDDGSDMATFCADVCNVNTAAEGVVVSCVLDDDRQLAFTQPLKLNWTTTPDSTYRALLYYNKVEGKNEVEPINAIKVFTLVPLDPSKLEDLYNKRDPLEVVAVWFSKNGKHLNLRLKLKSGFMEKPQPHILGLACDSVCRQNNGKHYYYSICHSQNGVPADYSVDAYASVPTDSLGKGDVLTLTIPSWKGTVNREIIK